MVKGFKKNGTFVPTAKRIPKGLSKTQLQHNVDMPSSAGNEALMRKKTSMGDSKNYSAYNVKLKKTETIKNPKKVVLKNGRHAVTGVGSDGTKLFRFIPKQ